MPNCVATFEGSNVSIRTIKPVVKGEEITISYIESIEGRGDRQNELQERYLFKCICPKCIDDAKINSLLAGKCPKSDCRESIFAGRNSRYFFQHGIFFIVINIIIMKRTFP